jgi:hypothetical protein
MTFLVMGDDPLVGFEFGDRLSDANQPRIAVTDEARKIERPAPAATSSRTEWVLLPRTAMRSP